MNAIPKARGIHKGEATHNQDQVMLFVNLRIVKIKNNVVNIPSTLFFWFSVIPILFFLKLVEKGGFEPPQAYCPYILFHMYSR